MFQDLKVVELASVLAGPSVGMFFAELGAQVTKIESAISNGDVTRNWKLPCEENGKPDSAYFNAINYGKSHLFLDFNEKDDLDQTKELIKNADILISNFKVGSAEKFDLDFESVKRLNPRVIHVNLVGFEKSNKVAYDVVLQAETAWLSMTGSSEKKAKIPVAMIDLMAAHQMKEAALIGLIERSSTGKGAFYQISLEKASLSSLANLASNYLNEKAIAKPHGTLHPNIAPYGELVKTNDGIEFVLAVGSDQQFNSLLEVLSLNELKERPEYLSNKSRIKNRLKLHQKLIKACLNLDSDLFEKHCQERRIPIGRLRTIDEVLDSHVAKELIIRNDNGSRTLSSIAFKKIC